VVEADRVDPLHPGGVLVTQVLEQLQHRPHLERVLRRDPRFGQPALGQQVAQRAGVYPVALRAALAPPGIGVRSLRRLGQVRHDPRPGQLLHDIPPASAPFDREGGLQAREPGEPLTQPLPVRGLDPSPAHLAGLGIQVVEGDLLSVQIQSAYDAHQGLLTFLLTTHSSCA
jgi:hypothetical protein